MDFLVWSISSGALGARILTAGRICGCAPHCGIGRIRSFRTGLCPDMDIAVDCILFGLAVIECAIGGGSWGPSLVLGWSGLIAHLVRVGRSTAFLSRHVCRRRAFPSASPG